MNIVVLCGGTSSERAVSLVTGEQVCRALRKNNENAVLLDVFVGHEEFDASKEFLNKEYDIDKELEYIRVKEENIESQIKSGRDFFGPSVMDACKAADIVFLALHGANGEDGKVQAVFDLNGIKYTGCDYLSSAIAMNKTVTKQIFKATGVPCAESISVKNTDEVIDIEKLGMNYPVVVKVTGGGSSVGVYIVSNFDEYRKSLDAAFEYDKEVVVERYIKGREFSVGVIGYEALPEIEIIPKEGFYDYVNKYKAGATIENCPANISEELRKKMKEAACSAAKALGLSVYCRVDVMTDENENCYCLEANTLPGMTPTSLLPQEALAVGMDFSALCKHLVEVSLKKY